ncbi:MAG: Uncharacterized protein LiPW15_816 [Parcubacteria group bacterium LiPW_15]|nr:MAG: Uncharacterized protein LiPW15_816 [Parcubacteria group bacterium LiPW_15]
MKRFLKHFFYGIFYLAILTGIGYLAFLMFIKPPASCFDNRQNQSEPGVDCGGPCAKICLPSTIRPLTLSGEAQLFSTNGLWSVLFWPENPNPDYAITSFKYAVNIYDEAGLIVKTLSGDSFLYASEIKYIDIPAINLGGSVPAKAEFQITDPVWIEAGKFSKPNLVVQSPSASISGNNVEYRGRIVNRDTVPFATVKVVAIFNDAMGNRAGVSETEIQSLAPGENKEFTILYPASLELNLDSIQPFVYAARK